MPFPGRSKTRVSYRAVSGKNIGALRCHVFIVIGDRLLHVRNKFRDLLGEGPNITVCRREPGGVLLKVAAASKIATITLHVFVTLCIMTLLKRLHGIYSLQCVFSFFFPAVIYFSIVHKHVRIEADFGCSSEIKRLERLIVMTQIEHIIYLLLFCSMDIAQKRSDVTYVRKHCLKALRCCRWLPSTSPSNPQSQ